MSASQALATAVIITAVIRAQAKIHTGKVTWSKTPSNGNMTCHFRLKFPILDADRVKVVHEEIAFGTADAVASNLHYLDLRGRTQSGQRSSTQMC